MAMPPPPTPPHLVAPHVWFGTPGVGTAPANDPTVVLAQTRGAVDETHDEQGTPYDRGQAFSRGRGANGHQLWAAWGAVTLGLMMYLRSSASLSL